MAARTPKTPSRHRSRSEVKTPLTPSLMNALNGVSLGGSPTKAPSKPRGPTKSKSSSGPFEVGNPFIAPSTASRSRPPSPVKRATSNGIPMSESLVRQARGGVIRKGGVESRLDIVTRDYVPPPPKSDTKRSRSTPAANRVGLDQRDRFITSRDEPDLLSGVTATLEQTHLNPRSSSPGHTARLASATGVPLNRRILAYHEPPPAASSALGPSADNTLAAQREIARPLYARPGALPSSNGVITNKTRKIASQPERVLDAPGMVDDFYLNVLSWSCNNAVAVALGTSTYVWRADTGTVSHLCEAQEGTYTSSVSFSNDGAFLGVGNGAGDVELWDVETNQKLRTMSGHQGQVATLSWHAHILSSGCGDGSIWHHDVRIPRHKVMELLGHSGEVCGLSWREDGELIASGGNDNVVNIWDGRLGDVGEGARGSAKWTKRNHTAAVKAIAWCPWQPSLLASGGGTNDATINIWNTTTGARLHTTVTPAQVTSVIWSPHRKELFSTHGYPTNSLMVHAYPSLERVAEIRDAHDCRVLFSALSPQGDTVCTGAGDENLKFWRVWEAKKEKKDGLAAKAERTGTTRSGILSIR